MINSTLDKRLLSCADYVRAGAVFADIGTDHGYLPIFLLKEGRIERAFLTDVNKGPLASAMEHVRAEGLSDTCEFMLTDGAAALSGLGITDYAICGMGGELIAAIIGAAPHLKTHGTRLILQPMTKQAYLRSYLASKGFSILSERYTFADGKYYLTILAEYDGEIATLDKIEAELGKNVPHDGDRDEYLGYLEARKNAYVKAKEGKQRGGLDSSEESEILRAISDKITELLER